MEVPQKLQNLYRHWESHTRSVDFVKTGKLNNSILTEMESFILERMRVWENKASHRNLPYTNDNPSKLSFL